METAQERFNDFQRGLGTATAPCMRDLARQDSKPIPPILLAESSPNLGSAKIPVSRYTAHDFHREEVEKVWKRSWQVVCREDEIPDVGDHFVYDVARLSFVVVRATPTAFKAFWNTCLHRGRRLVDESGSQATQFRCRYHAWTWSLEGQLTFYPGAWDFPDVQPRDYALRQAQVDTWGGFVFLNPDLHGIGLAAHMGSLPEHFAHWPLDRRFTLWHVQKEIACNWKVTMEAFLEAYHVIATHPQALSSIGEHGTQYDVYEQGPAAFSRLITPTGVPSQHARDGSALGAIADVWAILNGLRMDEAHRLPASIDNRTSLAAWRRDALQRATGTDYGSLPDTLMLDSHQYWLFPNFCPWLGEGLPLVYQFRPNTDSPDTSFMDVWMLIRQPDEGPVPPAPKMVKLGQDDPFEPVIGGMGTIFDQDDSNMPQVQLGMRNWPGDPEGVTLARYQESRIRFFHQVLMRRLALP